MSNQGYRTPKIKTPVDGNMVVWCPFCNWKQFDSLASRKRLGVHLVNDHDNECFFVKGQVPPGHEELSSVGS